MLNPWGLSPRRRGNRLPGATEPGSTGPIPAQAGEPCGQTSTPRRWRAYPRAGGGTSLSRSGVRPWWGLSPRRRGNRAVPAGPEVDDGPIPAQAGEPGMYGVARAPSRAYPRAGGGTSRAIRAGLRMAGLSPRRRGNRSRGAVDGFDVGPIPAQAGEPSHDGSTREVGGAYPRAGGGTFSGSDRTRTSTGLSPRRRGNPELATKEEIWIGPIPAQAGEPQAPSRSPPSRRAYPRAGGGTASGWIVPADRPGLSPRRRGNPIPCSQSTDSSGPIPAQAGEP